MPNLLLEEIVYKTETTRHGTWRRYGYIDGSSYHEFTSMRSLFGIPLVHYTCGRCPETGRRKVARGIIAVGRFAYGFIAVGHASVGFVAIGQLAIGLIFGIGQLALGAGAVGQLAIGFVVGLGQFATGYIAIGQFVGAYFGLGQFGLGKYLWTMHRADEDAVMFFKAMPLVRAFIP
jgi:hypothetical protein